MKQIEKESIQRVRIFLIILISLLSISWLDPYRDEVSSGNSEFHQKKYKDAKKHYKKAEKYAPGEKDKKKLSFNKGDADYMLDDNESAISNYESSIQSEDRDVQKKAFFNIGNTYMKQGNYKEAINSYINALKIDPGYERAKKNIEYILKNKKNKDDKKNNQGKNKNKKSKDDKNKSAKDKNRNKKDNQKKNYANRMNREQIQNILKSMKKKPVRRRKGSSNERRRLEKYW